MMGRKVRMVSADWVHPVDDSGRLIPLHGRPYGNEAAEWDEAWAKWQEGLCENYGDGEKWKPIDPKHRHMRYTDYAGPRPSPDDHMPDWPAEQRTHYMMYEDTSEGTPISPAFATPEELARWLADTGASSFGRSTATYEQWLPICKGGWAPSMALAEGRLLSGVEAMSELPA